jgi:hypothetical protein
MTIDLSVDDRLKQAVAGFYDDPFGFVRFIFPWAEGSLDGHGGPDTWQKEVLDHIGRCVCESSSVGVRAAVASGHGVGKTALIAWLILWFMSTRPHPQIVVTANTKTQLETKTWRELARWHRLALNRHWFQQTATRFFLCSHPETWFAAAIPWSKERSEAFAGTHEKHVLVLYDEASIIPEEIWQVTEGAMTSAGAMWIVFGNPTRNTGRFARCFGKDRHLWWTRQVDSRTSRIATNRVLIDQWVRDYGEDSDFVRVRVRGEFPRASARQLIPGDLVDAAAAKVIHETSYRLAPRVLGVDVARFGDDQSVIIQRQGLAASGLKKFRHLDTMTFAGLVGREIESYKPDAVFVDAVGIGAGVVDRLNQLGYGAFVIPVNAGERAMDQDQYHNLRTEMWDKTRAWLRAGGGIPDDRELKDDLTGPEYQYDARDRLALERKEDMKARGLASPDCGDALALTFARPVHARGHRDDFLFNDSNSFDLTTHGSNFDPMTYLPGGVQCA